MRLLATAVAVAAAAAFPATAHATHYPRECGGTVDVMCWKRRCPMDCFLFDCTVWIDPHVSEGLEVCV